MSCWRLLMLALTVIAAVLVSTVTARAQSPSVLELGDADSYDVVTHARIFPAAAGETIESYEALRDAGRFATPDDPRRRLHEGGAVWILLDVRSASAREWVIWNPGAAQALDARIQVGTGAAQVFHNGFFVSPQDRPLQAIGYAFPLPLAAGQRAEIALRGYLPPREDRQLVIASASRFLYLNLISSLLVFGVMGAALALGAYNATMFLVGRERAYGYYALYALSSVFLWGTTHSVVTLFTRDGPAALTLNGLAAMFTVFAALRFTHEFLELKQTAPRLHVVYQVLSVVIVALVVVLFAVPQPQFKRIAAFVAVPTTTALVGAPVHALVRGHRRALLMVIGWTPLMALPLVIGLRNLGLVEGAWMSNNVMLVFHGFEILTMALAVAQRWRELDAERARAQNEALEQMRLRLEQSEQLAHAELASVSAREEAERERLRGSIDALTGLRNRRAFESEHPRVNKAFAHDSNTDVLLCIVDVDGLKTVNDRAGHAEGDRLLATFGQHLASSLRGMDRIYRLGGDEFAVFARAPDLAARDAIEGRIRAAAEELKKEFPDGGASLGSALLSETDGNVQEAYRLADERMYREKRAHYATRGNDGPQPPQSESNGEP